MDKTQKIVLTILVIAAIALSNLAGYDITKRASLMPYMPGTFEYAEKVCSVMDGLEQLEIGNNRFVVTCKNGASVKFVYAQLPTTTK